MRAFNVFSLPSVLKLVLVRSMDAHQQLRARVDALEEAVSTLTTAQPVVTDDLPQGSSTTPIRYPWVWPMSGKAYNTGGTDPR